jgi:hypothetical protein
MLPFILGNKTFELPTRHGELTLKQFLQLRAVKDIDIVTLLSIITKTDKVDIMRISQLDFDIQIAKHIEFLNEPFDYIFPMPLHAEIEGKIYMIPEISRCTFGQKVTLEQVYNQAAKDGKNEFDVYSNALSIYFQPLIQSKEFHENYLEVENLVLEMPIEQALPIAAFFLHSWKNYELKKKTSWRATIPLSKSKQGFTILKSLGLLRLSTALRGRLISLMMRFSKWTITQSLRLSTTRKKRQSMNEILTSLQNDNS